MKKSALFLGLILLTGCSFSRSEDEGITLIEESNQPEPVIVQEVATVKETEFLTPTLPPEETAVTPAPVQASSESPKSVEAVSVSDDGRVLELPAQKIYLDPDTMTLTLPASDEAQPTTLADSVWFPADRPTAVESPRLPQAVVTLQDTADRNHYAQCAATNLDCIKMYESRGYRHIRGLPHFAGYRDVPLSSDYPVGGRWRNNNNIPRW